MPLILREQRDRLRANAFSASAWQNAPAEAEPAASTQAVRSTLAA
jgi:hypothetical protein